MRKSTSLLAVVVLLAGATFASGAVVSYQYDAALDTPGDETWENEAPATEAREFTFNGGETPTASAVTSGFANITKAYAFGGANLDGADAGTGFKESDVADADNTTGVTYEVWVKPDNLTDSGIIFETGASSGLAIYYDAGTIGAGANNATDLPSTTISDVSDFIQIVVAVEGGNGANLYVNTISSLDPALPAAMSTDLRDGLGGGDNAGLGNVASRVGGYVPDVTENVFEGQIAMFRIYDDELSSAEVAAAYNAMLVPEPTTMGLLAMGGLAFLRRRRS
jgi:hypothetical protein